MEYLVVGAIAGYAAFLIGKWRQTCVFWEMRAPFNVPMGWNNPSWRFGSWVLVAVLSLVFATGFAKFFSDAVHPWVGNFSWGVLLAGRWLASGMAAGRQGFRKLAEMQPEIEAEE